MRVIASTKVFKYTNENEYFNMFIGFCLTLYISGNRGVLDQESWDENDMRIYGSYPIPKDLRDQVDGEDRVWIITEVDQSVTTLIFPDEY